MSVEIVKSKTEQLALFIDDLRKYENISYDEFLAKIDLRIIYESIRPALIDFSELATALAKHVGII